MWRLQLASRIPLSPDLQSLRTHLPLTLLPLTRSYQPLVEEEEEEEEEEYLRSDTLTCVSITEYSTHALILQALRNLVNRSGRIAQNIFDQLDRRLKSADKKEQSGVRGQGVRGQGVGGQGVISDGVLKKQKTKNKGRPPNIQTNSITVSDIYMYTIIVYSLRKMYTSLLYNLQAKI